MGERRRNWGGAVICAVAFVAWMAAPAASTTGLPRRLVVGVDGLGYAEVQAAQAAGAFRRFFPVSRMVSTFPSISDIAWSEIFGVSPPPGYQRVYFRLSENRKVGGPIDPIRPIEFERRMDLGFEQKAHHISSYVSPVRTARDELSTLSRVFFRSRGIETFYAYLPAPDALQHVRGSVPRYLAALDHELTTILDLYRHRTGTDLELVLVSDHGNNQRWDAETIDLDQFLRDRGYRAGNEIARPAEVAFSTDGVATGVGVFVGPREVEPLSHVLATLRGVEFVTAVVPGPEDRVGLRDSVGGVATIARRANGDLAYLPLVGDPLRYAGLAAGLKASGLMDEAGFASPRAWFEVSKAHRYPVALDRIVRGHHDVTANPAPILLSIKDGFQVASGMVSFFNQLRPLGGTHGGLNAINSLGIVMSNFTPTVDASSHDVARQFDGFPLLAASSHSGTTGR